MHFVITNIHDTVIAYNVSHDRTPLGQVYLRDEYWHGRPDKADGLVSGGPGFVLGRGYPSRAEAAAALRVAQAIKLVNA